MTVGLANQGLTYVTGLSFYVTAVASLVTGAVFMMWLGEQITERGVGNGISLLIFAGIVAGLAGGYWSVSRAGASGRDQHSDPAGYSGTRSGRDLFGGVH
jgi:preprotein translocase subunit SecY